jgi:hypothetical protein
MKRRQELEVNLEENLPSAPPAAPNLIPECPVCYESMATLCRSTIVRMGILFAMIASLA